MTGNVMAQCVCVQPGGGKLYPCHMIITTKNYRLQLYPLYFLPILFIMIFLQ